MVKGSIKCKLQDAPDVEEPLLDHGNFTSNDKTKAKARACETLTPYENAGFFSSLTFSWLNPLFALGVEKKTLDLNDVPQLGTYNSVFGALPHFQEKFNDPHRVVTTELGLAKAYFLSAWKEILWTALLALIYTYAHYVTPYLIDNFVQCLNGSEAFKYEGYFLVLTFSIASFLEVFIRRHWIFRMQQVAIRLRGVTIIMIYNKCFTLPSGSSQLRNSEASGDDNGEVINLVAVDVETIKGFIVSIHDTWLIFLQIALALLILYSKLGLLATIGALIVTFGFMLINSFYMKWQKNFQTKLMESKDNRMKATKEILKNMRALKFHGWEMNFLLKILQLRTLEMQWLKKYMCSGLLVEFFSGTGPTFVALVAFGSCIYLKIPLELGKILSALATFRVLQEPIFLLPDRISMFIQARVSLRRIASFLSLNELEDDVLEKIPLDSSDISVEIVDGNFNWDDNSSPTLKDINLKVSNGMKVGICGVVGSGKSSLLSCILGEMPRISGRVKLSGTMAYVAQSPWIQSGTLQENILFGKEMDFERYHEVLRACSLKKDLEILSFGDQTVIGERGINLSGGQKQRIQIARALYHDVDIYLFDDPFSAVDAHTGSHLYKEVILGLLRGKTVIYVTHQVEFLNLADQIVVMKNGRIAQMGMYKDILIPGSAFRQLVDARHTTFCTNDFNMVEPVFCNNESMRHVESYNTVESSVVKGESDHEEAPALVLSAQLIRDEEREKGRVSFSVYWKYMTTAYGGALVFLIIPVSILLQSLRIGSTYWLAWASPTSMNDKLVVNGSTFMIVYASLAIGSCFVNLASDMLVLITAYKTATLLFSKMLGSIFHAPMSFFDSTPTGRILSRCSTDQSVVETQIPSLLNTFIFTTVQLLGILAVMSMVAWQVLIIFIPLILASIWYQQYYMPSSRELSRLSGVCEAPVIQFFSETISGMTTIRSFDRESRFRVEYMKIVDSYACPQFYNAAAMKWLLMRLDTSSCITFAFFLALLVYFANQINPAIAGLAVTYVLTLNVDLSGLIWSLCHAETKMISVERILQYMAITSEAPLVIQENRPEVFWPSHGEIVINSLQVQYAPHLPLVLHGVTCTFPGGRKTGIVGRTGSGKSTLIQALFRIVEPTSGRILIDGINISYIGLQDLRSRLSIIPQDPTMFEGTIRSNLDPFEQYTDEQIWDALHKCQLGDEVKKMDKKLDSNVHENGENWSMGQRQLICLGRVLLKKSKVLVLDEATASVDSDTDILIQHTLKHQFSDSTIITIAHRVTSVLDSSMVLLLNHGVVEEYDSPGRLLQNKSSSFSQLSQNTQLDPYQIQKHSKTEAIEA